VACCRPVSPLVADVAQWESYGANKSHGLRRSNSDKQKAVKAALLHSKGATESDRAIAEHCGVSDPFVGKLRKQMEGESGLQTVSSRTGRDGRTINTTNIGKPRKPAEPVEPDEPDDELGTARKWPFCCGVWLGLRGVLSQRLSKRLGVAFGGIFGNTEDRRPHRSGWWVRSVVRSCCRPVAPSLPTLPRGERSACRWTSDTTGLWMRSWGCFQWWQPVRVSSTTKRQRNE
jgi:hypothetical protein